MSNKTVTVTATKSNWEKASYVLYINGIESEFDQSASRLLTDTLRCESIMGIFNPYSHKHIFWREGTQLCVDLDTTWDITRYSDPAQEIARRVSLVSEAFEEVRENYQKSWTVTL